MLLGSELGSGGPMIDSVLKDLPPTQPAHTRPDGTKHQLLPVPFCSLLIPGLRLNLSGVVALLAAVSCSAGEKSSSSDLDWTHYGGNPGGTRYSTASQIDRNNVRRLKIAWAIRSADFPADAFTCSECPLKEARFETTPLMRNGLLYVSTPLNRVLALDPSTGTPRWRFDPAISHSTSFAEGLTTRGVSYWSDSIVGPAGSCTKRVFLATLDARLFALDADVGGKCEGFGKAGVVTLGSSVGLDGGAADLGKYSVTSPPAVIGDLVVVGSTVEAGRRQSVESGVVRAFDARTGTLRWTFDPVPRDSSHPAWHSWTLTSASITGAANVWSVISVDPDRGLVFLPTASAAPPSYGSGRPGRNEFANSVVALRAADGSLEWGFQVVHHDLWDYDLATQPLLIEAGSNSSHSVSALVVGTKTGMVFVLNRETGTPLFPVEERAVPPSDVPSEAVWPTQPFPPSQFQFHPLRLTTDSVFGVSDEDRLYCRESLRKMRNEGLFTPPSRRGSLTFPGAWGGINWDGLAWEPAKGMLMILMKRVAMVVQLHSASDADSIRRLKIPGLQLFPQEGTPFIATRRPFIAQSGIPCSPPPWSELIALHLPSQRIRWRRPLGEIPTLSRVDGSKDWGSLAFGGPLLTAGGLVFVGSSQDDYFRAFDIDTGALLWEHKLPAGGQAAPMTYVRRGRQFVVIAAGGRAGIGTPGDWVVAFTLGNANP